MKKPTAFLLPALLLCPALARGATLVTYNFNSDGTAVNSTAGVSGGVATAAPTATGLTFEPSVNFASPNTYPTNVLRAAPSNSSSTNLTEAVANDNFFTVTLTGNLGVYSLSDISLQAARGGASSARGFSIRSSLTGNTDLFTDNTVPSLRPALTNYSIPLTDPAFAAINGDVTFRIYVFAPLAGNSVDFDNIVFNGTAVPEPSALLLSALGLVPLLHRKR